MREWEKVNLVDFIKGEDETLEIFGVYIQDKKERNNIEANIEEVSEKILLRIDESLIADFDYSDESLEAMENIIDDGFREADEIDPELIEDLVMALGSYLGLTILKNLGGEWRFRPDLVHSSVYFPSIESECFPFHRTARRLLYGKLESLPDFYTSLLEIFGITD